MNEQGEHPPKLFIQVNMRFKSGMLGVCIVVLAMLGSVLGGFILGIESSTRPTTDYEYVTDVTGLFDITETPEYVEYSPSSNLIGYTPSDAVQFSESSTVNPYRYVKQDGVRVELPSQTVAYSSEFVSDTDRFLPSEMGTQAFINWNGSINFGNTVSWHGIDYNGVSAGDPIQVGEYMSAWPKITTLSTVISSFNIEGTYDILEIDLTYGSFPVMFYYSAWNFTNIERGDGYTQYAYSATLNEDNTMPTHLTVSMGTNTVKGYRNGNLMWNTNASQIDVIYRYSTRADGSFNPAQGSSVTMSMTGIGYPTYGYMDPTKGISMTTSDYSVEYSLPANASNVYNLANCIPPDGTNTNSFAYISNFTGWSGSWNGSITVADYTFQGIVPMTVVDPDMPRLKPNIQSFKEGIVNNFNLNEYDLYTLDFTNNAFPIYMSVLFNGRPDNFLKIGSVVDSTAHQIHTMWYLETGYTPVIDRATYNPNTDVVTAYSYVNGNYVQRWTSDADNIWMITEYYLLNSALQNVSPTSSAYYVNRAPINTAIHITAERDVQATWSNDYQNDEIYISVQRMNLNGNDLTIRSGSSYITLTSDTSGYIRADINGTVYNIGVWKNLQLKIDATDRTISITPATRISFTDPINETNATRVFDGWGDGTPITSLGFTTTDQSLRWQITRTTVFLDTFNAVMYNPTLDITQHFPDIDKYRLNFYSFAIYGDSISINNVPFTVNRADATVSFTLDDKSYTEKLQNIYITEKNVDGDIHTILSFGNSKADYDLGVSVTDTIRFGGLWYFTTGLYKVVESIEDYFDWNLDGLWHITSSQFLVIFIGLLGVGLIVMKGLFKVSLKSLDGIIIIFAGIIITMVVI